jgi:transcriptional regulator CtsR
LFKFNKFLLTKKPNKMKFNYFKLKCLSVKCLLGFGLMLLLSTSGFAQSCAGSCPAGYSVYLCGRCWVDVAQARAGGCTENCPNTTTTIPTAPSNLSVSSASSSQINLTWRDNSTNETGFLVERATGTGAFVQVASLGANTTSYNSTGLTASSSYSFRIRATNVTGNSAYSNTATATTKATTTSTTSYTIRAKGTSGGEQIQLKVNGAILNTFTLTTVLSNFTASGLSGTVRVEFINDSANKDAFVDYITVNATTYQSENQAINTGFYANNRCGGGSNNEWMHCNGYIEYATTSIGVTAPAAPSSLGASAASSSQINLSWADNSANETGFLVEQATGSGAFVQVATLGANVTTYSATGLVASTAYGFRVRATNATGNSAYSNTATATTAPATTTGGGGSAISGKFTPPAGKTMLIIGQDLASVSDYTNTANGFPVPAGVTTYLNFWNLTNSAGGYGALGLDNNLVPVGAAGDIDWGGGPLNAYSSAVAPAWANSTLQIGLYMVEYGATKQSNTSNTTISGVLPEITNGNWDAEIIKLKGFIKKIAPKPVYLRIGYEFDGAWNHYDQTNYINSYKHIVDVMRSSSLGGSPATNVAFVWQACSSPIDDLIDGGRENIGAYYPGDAYVDWVALSWFLLPNELPTVGGNPATQYTLAKEVVDFGIAHNKPTMIAESTAQGYTIAANSSNSNLSSIWDGASGTGAVNKTGTEVWNEWFTPFFKFIHDNSNAIRAVSYINANWNVQGLWKAPYNDGYWGDTRVQMNPTVKTNWNNEVSSSFWIAGGSTLFSNLSTARVGAIMKKINTEEDTSDIVLFPNPNTSRKIESTGLKTGMTYEIFDLLGVLKMKGNIAIDNETIDVSGLSSGMYLMAIHSVSDPVYKKIVLE